MIIRRKLVIAILGVVAILSSGYSALPVSAKGPDDPLRAVVEYNEQTVVRPDLGAVRYDLVPGQNGYKVFNPGAIAWAPAIPHSVIGEAALASPMRRGNTDVVGVCCNGADATHSSDSDLLEDKITADGTLRKRGQPIGDTCSHQPTNRSAARCTTSVRQGWATYDGATVHTFKKSGYENLTLNTADSVG
jgi:hypothetical protein